MSTRTDTLEEQAIAYARRGDFGPAARDLNDELARLAPDNAGAWTRLGRCCLELGQLEQATAALDHALQLNPQNTIARSLQLEVTRRRMGPAAAPAPRRRAAAPRTPTERPVRTRASSVPVVPGLARQDFTTLGHLPADAALDALGPRLEPLLMAINERPFAGRVVEARNRAGQPAITLFRRNSFQARGNGQLVAFQYGGRWEPQINIGLLAAPQWGRDALRAGIAFDLAPDAPGADREDGQRRALTFFTRFQQLVSSSWRQLLATWMSANGGFIQYGDNRPSEDLLPSDAVTWLAGLQHPADTRWVFCGRFLFADRADHAETLADGRRLVEWIGQTFSDLLPLWTTVYRG
jgi:hypothetical protein